MKKNSLFLLAVIMMTLISFDSFSQTQQKIDAATDAGKAVFLVVSDPGVADTDKALEIAKQSNKSYSNSTVIQMNRSEPADAELVKQFGLAGAPLPVILVLSQNGSVTGGFVLAQATPEKLVSLIPSPKKAEVLQALGDKKSVFIVATSKTMTEKSDILGTCAQACVEMQQNAKVIEIDLDDPKEAKFLAELKIDRSLTSPQTFVINTKGQVTGKFDSSVNSATLVASAKKVSSGCGPGSSCGPKQGCGK
jgi:hypothetical protein